MAGCFFSANKGLKSPFFIGKKGENMTEINLMTSDQRLIAIHKVVIASGDVNSVRLNVIFDSHWGNYDIKTATFHTADDPTPHEILLTNGSCTVPPEVLQKPGTLFIGVIGENSFGDLDIGGDHEPVLKTSTLVKYKIEQGAPNNRTTLAPSLDLFQQYLKALEDKVDPIRADVYAKLDEKLEEANKKLLEVDKKISTHEQSLANITEGVLLWENPSPSQAFSQPKIKLDLSDYKKIKIITKVKTSSTGQFLENEITFKNVEYCICASAGTSREATWTDTGIIFGQGDDGEIFDNEYAIPVKIIGFKSGGIKPSTDDGGIENDGFDL